MDLIKIGKFIVSLRRESGISQLQLAKYLGVSNSAVCKWEQGLCLPSSDKINKLIKYFNITLEEFYTGERIEKTIKRNFIKELLYTKKIIFLIIILILIFLVCLIIYNNKTVVYKINSFNNNYTGTGNIVISKKKNIITMTNLTITNENDLLIKSSCFEYFAMIEDELIIHYDDVKTCDGNNKEIFLKDYVKEIQINLSDDMNYMLLTTELDNKKLDITIYYLDDKKEIKEYIMTFDIVKY